MYTLAIYEKENGKIPFKEWLSLLKDKTINAKIYARLGRVEEGNLGDMRPVGNGVFELRLSFGSGYRIYYGVEGEKLIILLLGGDKSSQVKDIKLAHRYWSDYLRRNHYGKN